MKDSDGQQFNYAHDRIGRLSSVTGTTAFDGITNYALYAEYNARGILTALDYGNGVEMNVTAFNNKLQATEFEVKKGAASFIKKQYQFYADGSLKFIDDQLADRFDRSYKYDHLGRTVIARAGVAARGVPSNDPFNADRPYMLQYGYDAFGNMLGQSGLYYQTADSSSHSFGATDNRNPAWTYDADGNTVSDTDATYDIDAAGQVIKTGARDYDNDGQFLHYTLDSFDGAGGLTKRISYAAADGAGGQIHYYIRSSVLGKVIMETDWAGRKLKTFVPANGTTLAEQELHPYTATPIEKLTFTHTDASGTGIQRTKANGALVGNTTYDRTGEYDPLGRNIADAAPYITPDTNEPTVGGVNMFGSGEGYRPGQASYQMDGLRISQAQFMVEINSGRFGGMFGLLERSARMSALREIGRWVRTETWRTDGSNGDVITVGTHMAPHTSSKTRVFGQDCAEYFLLP